MNNTIIESVFSMENVFDIKERLLRLDEDASLMFDGGSRFSCIIVGGSAMILLGYVSRSTHDIDMLETPKELMALMQKYDMNTDVSAHMDNFPSTYRERIQKIDLETEKIDFYTLSLEDLVISKLAAGRDIDMADVTKPTIINQIDWDRLSELAKDVVVGMLSDRAIDEFRIAYQDYVKRYRK